MTCLFISYYKATTPERQAEIDHCLKANCENPLIDRVYVIHDNSLSVSNSLTDLHHTKIYHLPFHGKPTYEDFISFCNENPPKLNDRPNDINIISNADIIFDESLSHLNKLGANDCWALSRWEMKADYTKHPQQIQVYGDSQDVWIFRGKIKKLDKADFPLGMMGCDNRIAYEIHKAGYNITNPSRSVFTWHLHNSGVRGYNPSVRNEHTVVSQPYHYIKPTSL